MAASITNSNETSDSITTGLLIHEVGLFLPPTAPSLRGLCFHIPSFPILLDTWYISCPHAITLFLFIVIIRAAEHCFIWECFQSKPCNAPQFSSIQGKSYFWTRRNNREAILTVGEPSPANGLTEWHKKEDEHSATCILSWANRLF